MNNSLMAMNFFMVSTIINREQISFFYPERIYIEKNK